MNDLFLAFLNVSIEASLIIAALALLRLALKKCPAYIRCIIWAVVALRLIVPISIESAFSLMPDKIDIDTQETESVYAPDTSAPDGYTDNVDKPYESAPDYAPPTDADTPTVPSTPPSAPDAFPETETVPPISNVSENSDSVKMLSVVWIIGCILMLGYIIYNIISTYLKVRNAAVYSERIHITTIKTPFVFGFIKPRIYLPARLDDKERSLIIAHERAHIKRGDHISKILAFLVLSLHWFNPFVWLGYVLFSRDVELACDEKVIKDMSHSERQAYSFALLNCTTGKLGAAYSLLAFGEIGTKERVKKVMNYKKPTLLAICIALATCLVLVSCFATRPKDTTESSDFSIEVGTDSSEDDSSDESSAEGHIGNYARGCDYEVYYNGRYTQNGPPYLNGYDDTGLVKLTDGVIDDSIFTDGYGDTAKNAFYDDAYNITYVMDLGESHEDVSIIAFKNVYQKKPEGQRPKDLDVLVYVSDDKINFDYSSSLHSKVLVYDSSWFVRNDYYFYLNKPEECRYVKIEVRCSDRFFGLSEIAVYPRETDNIANIEWGVSNDRTLTIRGDGAMFIDVYETPWQPFSSVVTKIVIEDGITSIGRYAFSGFKLVTAVEIPDSVKQIDAGAFRECTALESVSLPDGITTIENETFRLCNNLSEVKFPKSLKSIMDQAFIACSAITKLALPDTIEYIGRSAFAGCNSLSLDSLPKQIKTVGDDAFPDMVFGDKLFIPEALINMGESAFGRQKHYEVAQNNAHFASENGVLFSKDKTRLISYPVLNESVNYNIPNGVENISDKAFYGAANLKSVSFSKGLKTVGAYAFSNCSSLEKAILPDSVSSVGEFAFYECSNLLEVNLPPKLTVINQFTFYNCKLLSEADIPSGVTSIGDSAFVWCSSMNIPVLPDGIQTIGSSAFRGCSKLKAPLPKSLTSIGTQAFAGCGFKEINIPEGVTEIGDGAFESCNKATSAYIPTTVKKIHIGSFASCNKLAKVSYGGTVEKWLAISVDPFVDSWSNIDKIMSIGIKCTNGTCGFIEVFSIDENGSYSDSGYYTYDGTIQGIVNVLSSSSSVPAYPFNSDIKVNSFRVSNTGEADVQIAYIDLSEEFSKCFTESPLRKNSMLYTLAATIIANHPELNYKDMVQISVNGQVLSDSTGAALFKNFAYSPPQLPMT